MMSVLWFAVWFVLGWLFVPSPWAWMSRMRERAERMRLVKGE